MDDERVDRLLRALPREMASPGFTARVLARLDRLEGAGTKPRTSRAPRFFGLPRITLPAAVLAATLAVAASLYLQGGGMPPAPVVQQPPAIAELRPAAPAAPLLPMAVPASAGAPRSRVATRRAEALLAQIRAQHLRLHDEVRRLREAQSSTVYLGGDEDMDLVVHLDRVRERPERQLDPPPYPFN
jgi:hypothetical protein